MYSFKKKEIFPYAAANIYKLVMDIEKYPEFLPWCSNAKIIEEISDENLRADLLINFKNFFEKYRSDVKYGKLENGYFIEAKAIQGPFKTLVNNWKIEDSKDGNSCEIEFFIEFEFNSVFITKLFSPLFEKASNSMMEAFKSRAKEIYQN